MPPTTPTDRPRATTSRLHEGEHTIDRSRVRTVSTPNGDQAWLDWSLRLLDGRVVRHRTKGRSAAEVRRRARAKARQLLDDPSVAGRWKPSSSLGEYARLVVRPMLDKAGLADSSLDSYSRALRRLAVDCPQHGDAHSLARATLATALSPRSLEAWIASLEALHGPSAARTGEVVLSGYVVRSALRDGLLAGNPMPLLVKPRPEAADDAAAELGQDHPLPTARQWLACVDWLLRQTPEPYLQGPDRRWTREQRLATVQGWFDLTALQAATGLRISEALSLEWDDVDLDHEAASASDRLDGQTLVRVRSARSKTKRGRWAPVVHPDVAGRLKLLKQRSSSPLVFPTATGTVRGRQNTINRIKPVYANLARAVDAPALADGRTHVWRSVLNQSVLKDADVSVRSAFLGHSAGVNRRYYTDATDVAGLVEAARAFLADDVGQDG